MIQLVKTASTAADTFRINIYDKMTNADYRPLVTFTSQASGNSFTSLPFAASYTKKERYVAFYFWISAILIPTLGYVTFGNTDLPYGFYDVTIYQNSSSSNIDPAGLTVVWKGLANLKQSGNPAVEYTDYDTNDADTESVYITF